MLFSSSYLLSELIILDAFSSIYLAPLTLNIRLIRRQIPVPQNGALNPPKVKNIEPKMGPTRVPKPQTASRNEI